MNRSQSPRRWFCDKDELLRQRISPSQRQQSAQDEPQKYVYVRLSLQDIIIIVIVIVIIIIITIIIIIIMMHYPSHPPTLLGASCRGNLL